MRKLLTFLIALAAIVVAVVSPVSAQGFNGGGFNVGQGPFASGGGTSPARTTQAVVWDTAGAGSGSTFANSDRDYTGAGGTLVSAKGTISSTSGQKYIEFQLLSVVGLNWGFGFENAAALTSTYVSGSPDGAM